MSEDGKQSRLLPSFGRRKGRTLSKRRKYAMAEVFPKYRIPAQEEEAQLSLAQLFPGSTEHWLEIGFGGGEHLLAQAAEHPAIGMIGCEPFIDGVANCLDGVHQQACENIRVWPDDVRLLLPRLPAASLSKVFILYPDPWPKRRHHKRRLFNRELLAMLARVMVPSAQLLLATDHPGYSAWALPYILESDDFMWEAQRCADWQQPPVGWHETRYERKCLAGKRPVYLSLQRISNKAR